MLPRCSSSSTSKTMASSCCWLPISFKSIIYSASSWSSSCSRLSSPLLSSFPLTSTSASSFSSTPHSFFSHSPCQLDQAFNPEEQEHEGENPSTSTSLNASTSSSSHPKAHAYAPEVVAWMKSEGARFEHVQPYTANFVSRAPHLQPFPMNPLFKPVRPLTDEERTKLYLLHKEDPMESSIERLAYRFGLSIERVKAILRLKSMEEEWKEKGQPLQTDFTRGMEEMLQIRELPSLVDEKKVRPIKAMPPYLIAIDADKIFEKEDALKILNVKAKEKTSSTDENAKEGSDKDSSGKPSVFLVKKGTKTWRINLNATIQQGFVPKVYKTNT